MTCELCGRPATRQYTSTGRTIDICDSCSARRTVQDAYESRLVELHQLASAGKYAEALGVLDALWAAHRSNDSDGWLERSLLAHRALLLGEQGDLDGAIAAQLRVIELAQSATDLASEGLALASLLERAGKLDDAAFASEQALAHATGNAVPTVIPLLVRYASIQRARSQAVPEQHRAALGAALAYYGIADNPAESIETAATRADQTLRAAQSRFAALRAELARLRDQPAQRADAIARYLGAESVEFFRQRAREL
jgi:hypothetical protein